jgi:hypothetical protein
MLRCLFALTIALAASAAAAQASDTLESADCRQALESLQAQEAAVLAARRVGRPADDRYQLPLDSRLETLRRQAAHACLGGHADPPLPSQRLAQPPVVVPPVAISRPAPAPALPAGSLWPSLKQAEPPTVIQACDAAGCWASDGSRLNRVGPNLLGPRGMCSVQGTVLHCP